MGASEEPASGFKSVSATVTTAFTAGSPPIVTRPLIEAVRGRLSRCGVCAPAHEADWLNATRSNIDRVEKRLSGLGFIGRLHCNRCANCLAQVFTHVFAPEAPADISRWWSPSVTTGISGDIYSSPGGATD